MKQQLLSLLFVLFSSLSLAQTAQDSLKGVTMEVEKIDSLKLILWASENDALLIYSKVDSVRSEFNNAADSLHRQYHQAIARVDGHSKKLEQTIDSLETLSLPVNKYERKLRKLADLKQKAEARFADKLSALKANTTDKLNSLDLPPEYQGTNSEAHATNKQGNAQE